MRVHNLLAAGILFITAFIIYPSVFNAHAYELRRGKQVYVGAKDTVRGTLYAAGSNITVDGRVTGDVICAGQSITLNGTIDGDLICGGQTIILNGRVAGNIRVAAQKVSISGPIGKNAMVFAQSADVDRDGRIGGELLVAGRELVMRGSVAGQLHGGVEDLLITGSLGHGMNVTTDSLDISADARVNGDITYTSYEEATIDGKSEVRGQVTRNEPVKPKPSQPENQRRSMMQGIVISVLSYIVLALVIAWVLGKRMNDLLTRMKTHPIMVWGWGLLLLVITPIAVFLVAMTIIGLPLAFIIGMLWIMALLVSRAITGILIGQYLLSEFLPKRRDNLYLAAVFGVLLLILACNVPYVGWLVTLISICWGLGGMVVYGRRAH